MLGGSSGPKLSPQRARIVALATSQLGYRTDPPDTYCNRFSAYWHAGAADCPNSNRDEQWCADFAAWVWHRAGVRFVYGLGPGRAERGVGELLPVGRSPTTPGTRSAPVTCPNLGTSPSTGSTCRAMQAQHVAVVVGYSPGARGPDVVNGDGERTGFSVVEIGHDQYKSDLTGNGGQLAGYVSPPPLVAPHPRPQ